MKLAYFTAKKALNSSIDCVCVSRLSLFVSLSACVILFVSTWKEEKSWIPRWCCYWNRCMFVWLTDKKERNERNDIRERGRMTGSSSSSSSKHTDYGTSYICISRNTTRKHTHTLFVNRDIRLFNLSLYHFRQHTNTVSLLSVCARASEWVFIFLLRNISDITIFVNYHCCCRCSFISLFLSMKYLSRTTINDTNTKRFAY